MNFDNVFLVSIQLAPVSLAEIDDLIKRLGTALPSGYKPFMTQFGEGDYCDFIRIYTPKTIWKEVTEIQQLWASHWFFSKFLDEEDESILSQEQAAQSIVVGSTIDGDYFMFYPPRPAKLYVLPRHSETISVVNADFSDLCDWASAKDKVTRFSSFQPYNNQARLEVVTERTDFKLPDLIEQFRMQWSKSPAHTIMDDEGRFAILFLQAIGARVQIVQFQPGEQEDKSRDGAIWFQIAHNKDASEAVDTFLYSLDDARVRKTIGKQREKQSAS